MDERKLRKYEHTMVISGVGIILFGVWSIVKASIFFLITPLEHLAEVLPGDQKEKIAEDGFSQEAIAYTVLVMILIILLVSLMIRLYIGRAAIQDGRRIRRRRPFYIVCAILIGVSLISSTIATLRPGSGEEAAWASDLNVASVSVVVDLTSLLCVVELIISAILVRKLRKKLGVTIPGRGAKAGTAAEVSGADREEAV